MKPTLLRSLGLSLLLALALAVPFVASGYQIFQATMVLVYAIALFGLNILTGYNGQISLGHGAFYAIGAYSAAILIDHQIVPDWATVPIAGAICLVVGYLFGRPAARLAGLYLALATFALAVATPQILKYRGFEHWTGGSQGIILDKPDPPAFLPIDADQWLYLCCLAVTLVLFVLGRNLLRGRIGRALLAIRDHPIAAASMGIDTARYKAMTFGVSAAYTGIAGALGTFAAAFASPDSFDAFLSLRFLVGIVVGGLGSISGAFFGAAFIEFVPNLADRISKAAPWAIYGVLLILVIYLMPSGVAGLIRAMTQKINRDKETIREET
ncbi:MAG: branched-chain amino acid transport system permease protein [Aliidongia sp.]|jgi:branched-chain amino acid transport system permease protein|nr:branched-chain amino acid transport system permease protein [Aliidongia sp.]